MVIGGKEYSIEFKPVLKLYKESATLRIQELGKDLIEWGKAKPDPKKLALFQRRWAEICEDILVNPQSAPTLEELGMEGVGAIGLSFFAPDSQTSESSG